MNPLARTVEVVIRAIPTLEKDSLIESSAFFPDFLASIYLCKKWTVSSTTIPNVEQATIDSAISTNPNVIPQKP